MRAKHIRVLGQYGLSPERCLDAPICLLRRHDVPSWSGRYESEIQEGGYVLTVSDIISSAQIAIRQVYAHYIRLSLSEGTIFPYAGASIREAFGS